MKSISDMSRFQPVQPTIRVHSDLQNIEKKVLRNDFRNWGVSSGMLHFRRFSLRLFMIPCGRNYKHAHTTGSCTWSGRKGKQK